MTELQYCHSPFLFHRRKTREVVIGNPANGGVIDGLGIPYASNVYCDYVWDQPKFGHELGASNYIANGGYPQGVQCLRLDSKDLPLKSDCAACRLLFRPSAAPPLFEHDQIKGVVGLLT